jgi:NADH:ubiquinone oxidoreductase subunit 5 (subunit L)/multisubunit Na+/H+ antiporter MnhA subunit
MFGSALTIASFMKLLHSVFLGRSDKNLKNIKEAGLSMTIPTAALAFTCVVFGIFAVTIPISLFIAPSVSGAISYLGIWNPAIATALIIAALILGTLAYMLMRPTKFRTVGVFVGGEDVNKLDRVTGTEFYNTVKETHALEGFYKKEASGSFDIYNIFGKAVYKFSAGLQKLHNGILPTYMVWCLLGMIGIFFVIFLRQ